VKTVGILVVLCVAATPVLADAVTYTFDVTSGALGLDISPDGIATVDPYSKPMAGTFAVTIYQSNGHIGESDTFILEDADLTNTGYVSFSLMGLAYGTIDPGSVRFLDFAPTGPGHIGPGGTALVDTDVYAAFTIIIGQTGGLINTTWMTATWAGQPQPLDMTFTTSGTSSDVLTVSLAGTLFSYEVGMSAITQTLTLDLIVDVVGTAHIVPDPALGGLTALGLAGGAAWLRRRG